MKKYNYILIAGMAVTLSSAFAPSTYAADKVTGWGDFKLYIDPGHEGTSNRGLWNYSEAEKVLDVALNIKQMLETTTDMPAENLKLCRYTQADTKGLEERSDEANAWGADFYYSIHSDAGNIANELVTLFGGWKKDGVDIEKTPNGGKRYGEILEPNLSGVMRIPSRGNWYDRCFYQKGVDTHENQFPYLSVNRRSNMPSL
ncbi:MAG: N-acetylmuramoyl-L-alanine amidase, partial [Muribaculaceae bacterium]|nr:N-acetylmuramoyl-L-alanine amidase [Muribaculaceae bacterium]